MSDEIPNWRALKPNEMPEYTLRPGNPNLSNWTCKRCWRSNTHSPFDSRDKQLASIINHVKSKYVVLACRAIGEAHDLRRHEIDQPTEEDYFFTWPDGVPRFVQLNENRPS